MNPQAHPGAIALLAVIRPGFITVMTAIMLKDGRRTVTWSYLWMVNEQLRVIGPIMNRLRSTGVYFAGPMGAEAAALPGRLVRSIDSEHRIMIGEFAGDGVPDHLIVVNLNLERSAKLQIQLVGQQSMEVYSPVDGGRSVVGIELWLPAGQGMLIQVR